MSLSEVDLAVIRKQFVCILQLSKHPDQHSDQGNGEPVKYSLFGKEDFKCDEKSNPKPDVTQEEFHHFVKNGPKIRFIIR